MRKASTFLLILASLGIISLLGLAGFLTYYMYDSSELFQMPVTETSSTELVLLEPSDSITTQTPTPDPCYGDDTYIEAEHFYIFVGDSRTVGMGQAISKKEPEDTCQFIAKSGEGLYWFKHEGIDSLREALWEHPDATVIFNLGVNDLKESENYISFYQTLFSEYHDPSFYIMSVNPVVDEECVGAKNEEVEDFNMKMQEAFPDKYLDCYHYLLSEDFKTLDGLHYPDSVYCRIHHFAVMILNQSKTPSTSNV